jgi:hypothetical protein
MGTGLCPKPYCGGYILTELLDVHAPSTSTAPHRIVPECVAMRLAMAIMIIYWAAWCWHRQCRCANRAPRICPALRRTMLYITSTSPAGQAAVATYRRSRSRAACPARKRPWPSRCRPPSPSHLSPAPSLSCERLAPSRLELRSTPHSRSLSSGLR